MFIKLNGETEEFWIDSNEIAGMIREKPVEISFLIQPEKKYLTSVILKSGKSFFCTETPEEIVYKKVNM